MSSEHKTDPPGKDAVSRDRHTDRWIWGVWVVIALIAVAILPFASRFQAVARTIAELCGFSI